MMQTGGCQKRRAAMSIFCPELGAGPQDFTPIVIETFHRKMKPEPSVQRVSIDGMRPLALTKKQTIAVLGSAKLVDPMLWATRHAGGMWFMIIREGRDLLVATESVESAYARLVSGEVPPLMPSERKANEAEA
jgi:hypothetical protein